MRKGRLAREERVTRAKARQEARNQRTPQQQLNYLDIVLGEDQGAKRERRRLRHMIDPVDQENSKKTARTRAARRKEKAERYARRQVDGN